MKLQPFPLDESRGEVLRGVSSRPAQLLLYFSSLLQQRGGSGIAHRYVGLVLERRGQLAKAVDVHCGEVVAIQAARIENRHDRIQELEVVAQIFGEETEVTRRIREPHVGVEPEEHVRDWVAARGGEVRPLERALVEALRVFINRRANAWGVM